MPEGKEALSTAEATDTENQTMVPSDDGTSDLTEKKEPSEKQATQATPPGPPAVTYPTPLRGAVLTVALLLAMFLVALDMSIITTAIPTITQRFHSLDQEGWYGSAFFLCLATFQAFWGKAYKYFPLKTAFLTAIGVFELGSLIAALAPNSPALIVGRSIQGVGGAGVTGGVYTILAFITRPKYLHAVFGVTSAVWSLSSVLGPILSGVFTQYVTWRWCFWVNLPIGGAAMIILLLLLKTPPHSRVAHTTLRGIPTLFDFPGMIVLVGAMVCLLLALEDGGVKLPWHNSVPIGLLIGFGLLLIVFVVVEWKQGEGAMVVPRIIKRRSILVLALFNLTAQGSGFARIYNLPIFFQAGQSQSPSESGIRTLPTVLTTSIFSFVGSLLLGKVGYYPPFLTFGAMFVTLGTGLMYTMGPDATAGQYIGYQVLAAIGSGLVIQLNVIVAQAITPRVDMSVTVATVLFFQFIGGTVGVSAATNIMNNVLINSVTRDSPNISVADVVAAGSGGLARAFPRKEDFDAVVHAYMNGINAAWIWCIALAGLAFLVSFGAEWKSLRPEAVKKRNEQKAAAAAANA
ncbi:MDR family MFS transporter [Aspergillus clavatus NRRL 1]|uniref:MFS transporter, putative n=1 Tax=Aspergillus clavatus (strain ATCC 1007 / CBS 513.65 / DSM 816 / NCTC 3887 / NRRL 1 / QM 1276 / 107) TaxID=344612 RepID=A1CDW6_ASPCL|nr:MFS transporter, putative [Aspergillus clavatus NRRL 1]EAW12043.1 MFS transporter, putative [Aspergillus clavatus NRRL 1]